MEAVVAQLKYYSGVYLKCLRKTTKTVMTGGPQACISSPNSVYEVRPSDKSIISYTDYN